MTSDRVQVDVHLGADELLTALRQDVRTGLSGHPKELPPKWFYDDTGSQLFDRITRLPEYYPTRREHQILGRRAAEIAELTGADTLVELGSGTSEKTRLLLDALTAGGTLRCFVPFDVCEPVVRSAASALAGRYHDLRIHALVADFERHLALLPGGDRRLIAFLGGTIGNLRPRARHRFLTDLAAGMASDDALLLGTDLVKDVTRLEAAYDDRAGITGAFNRNVLAVLNRQLGADFVLERFSHVARYDADQEWVEMLLRSEIDHTARVAALDMEVHFGAGEHLRTEVSAKFRREGVEGELLAAGFKLAHWWTDEAGDFAVCLAVPG